MDVQALSWTASVDVVPLLEIVAVVSENRTLCDRDGERLTFPKASPSPAPNEDFPFFVEPFSSVECSGSDALVPLSDDCFVDIHVIASSSCHRMLIAFQTESFPNFSSELAVPNIKSNETMSSCLELAAPLWQEVILGMR